MLQQVLVQHLVDTPDDYRWGVVNDKGQWEDQPQQGDKAALLSSLQSLQLSIVLVIPGEKVVTTSVVYNAAEKRHFRQLLPYQLEEQIIGNVEDLHFVTGPMTTDSSVVAYVDDAWFAETVAWYQEQGLIISRCVADFQLLTPGFNQWVIWSMESRALCFHSSGLGFSTGHKALQPLLDDVLDDTHADIQLYGNSEQLLDNLVKCLPDSLRPQATRCTGKPVLDLLGNSGINFCQGPYAEKLPLKQWWQASRIYITLSVATLLVFVAVNLLEIFQLKNRQQAIEQQIEQRYRQVAPEGVMVDPVKQLQRRLGTTDNGASKSQATYLISAAAPAIKAENINITALTYDNDSQELRLTIEAKAFSAIEKLRKQLQTADLQAELKRSDNSDDSVRARLHILRVEN